MKDRTQLASGPTAHVRW